MSKALKDKNENVEKKDKKQSKVQWFFMVIFIPAIFALILAVVILSYMGINVGEEIQKLLPFADDQGEVIDKDMSDEEKIAQLEHANQAHVTQISELEAEVTQLQDTIARLEEEIILLQEKENEQDKSEDDNGNDGLPQVASSLNEIVKTLEEMSSSKAAAIISQMEQTDAALYLGIMKVDPRSQILSKMDPAAAAQIISILSN